MLAQYCSVVGNNTKFAARELLACRTFIYCVVLSALLPSSLEFRGKFRPFRSFLLATLNRRWKKARTSIIITVRRDCYLRLKFSGWENFFLFEFFSLLPFGGFSGLSCGRQYKFNVSLCLEVYKESSQKQANTNSQLFLFLILSLSRHKNVSPFSSAFSVLSQWFHKTQRKFIVTSPRYFSASAQYVL